MKTSFYPDINVPVSEGGQILSFIVRFSVHIVVWREIFLIFM